MTTPATTPTTPPAGQASGGAPEAPAAAPTAMAPTATPAPEAAAPAGQPAQKPAEPVAQLEVTVPEGFEVDKDALTQFKTTLADVGVKTSEQANKIFGLYLAQEQKRAAAMEAQSEAWNKELRADPDIGGEKADENFATIQRVVKKLGGDALVNDIVRYNLGNLPSLARVFWKMKDFVKEDNSAEKGAPQVAETTNDQRLRQNYPGMFNADGTPKY